MIDVPRLVPYKAEHLMSFVAKDSAMYTWENARMKEAGGPAFTALIGDGLLGCGGVILYWRGVGVAWVVFNKAIEAHPVWMTRTVKRALVDIMQACNLHRVEMTALPENRRWAEVVGFTLECSGIARAYTNERRDVMRYERVL